MDTSRLTRKNETEWVLAPHGTMRVPGVLFADEQLIREMDEQVLDQVSGVASLPGIVTTLLRVHSDGNFLWDYLKK